MDEESLGHRARGKLLVSSDAHGTLCAHLHVTTFDLLVFAVASSFNTLSLHKLRLFHLLEVGLVSTELLLFEILNDFDASMFKTLSNEHLQDWLSFQVEIKQVKVLINHLNLFVFTLSVGDENGVRSSVDIVIWLNVGFINHVFVITELSHNFVTHLLLLHVHLLLLLHLKLHLLVVHHLASILVLLLLFELLLFHLLVTDHLHLSATFVFLDLLLLLHHHRVRLHVDGNDECCKGVTTHNTSVEHNILRSHFDVFAVRIFKLLGGRARSVH